MTVEIDADFEALLAFLRDSRGFDFTGYKRASLMRRVERRMEQIAITSFVDYQDYLQLHQDEFTALFNTILINVTAFFRDADAWTHLAEEVLPELLSTRSPDDPLRIWSAGCASGEEAYSIAAVLADLLGPDEFRSRVKIYATDVDEEALAQARSAAYSERDLREVPAGIRERYFEVNSGRFVFRSDLRRSVIFGRNELVSDAPISRVDLLLCRNTLMYFNAETQARVLQRLHFALADGGVLFLGKAEMLLSHGELFHPMDLRRRFFRKVPRPLSGVATGRALNSGSSRLGESIELPHQALAASPVATLLVTVDGTLASANARAEALFSLLPNSVGRPFRDLEVSFRPVALLPHIHKVIADRHSVWVRDVEWLRGPGDTVFLDVQLAPLLDADGTVAGVAVMATDVSRFRHLQSELERTNRQLETAYEELQSTVEELETTNEELQSTIEELETTNEELQSTNEELETMNEEHQTTNDELKTINDELRERTQELHDTSAFMQAILSSLRSAVVVCDADFAVQIWNSHAEEMWGLRPQEAIGQHLLSLDIGLPIESLRPMVRRLLANEDGGEIHLDAINRRGRAIAVRVIGTSLQPHGSQNRGAVLVMDEK